MFEKRIVRFVSTIVNDTYTYSVVDFKTITQHAHRASQLTQYVCIH